MIWGLKTVAFFDIWTLEHLLSGISIGSFSMYLNRKKINNEFKIDTLVGCAEEIGDAMQNICFAGYHMESNIEIEGIGWHRLKKVDRLNQIDFRDGFYNF